MKREEAEKLALEICKECKGCCDIEGRKICDDYKSEVETILKEENELENKGKHTPGPWKVCKTELSNDYYITAQCEHERAVVCELSMIEGNSIGNTENNARLIAAAPELLEACKASLKTLELKKKWGNGHVQSDNTLIGILSSAIEKAEVSERN